MFTTNFSERFKKTMSGFQKAFDELTVLKKDIATEKVAADDHVQKLEKAAVQVDTALEQLTPFVTVKK